MELDLGFIAVNILSFGNSYNRPIVMYEGIWSFECDRVARGMHRCADTS